MVWALCRKQLLRHRKALPVTTPIVASVTHGPAAQTAQLLRGTRLQAIQRLGTLATAIGVTSVAAKEDPIFPVVAQRARRKTARALRTQGLLA